MHALVNSGRVATKPPRAVSGPISLPLFFCLFRRLGRTVVSLAPATAVRDLDANVADRVDARRRTRSTSVVVARDSVESLGLLRLLELIKTVDRGPQCDADSPQVRNVPEPSPSIKEQIAQFISKKGGQRSDVLLATNGCLARALHSHLPIYPKYSISATKPWPRHTCAGQHARWRPNSEGVNPRHTPSPTEFKA